MDMRAGRWWRSWRGESRLLKTNATGGSVAYHTENTTQTNVYGNRSISLPSARSFYCKPSTVASYHGLAMSVVTIHCWRSCCRQQWVADVAGEDRVNHRRTASRNEQASWCSSLLHIADERRRCAVITCIDASVGVLQRRFGVTGIT